MYDGMIAFLVKLAILAMFVSAMIEVLKGISAIGFVGVVKGLIKFIWKNEDMPSGSFPVVNYLISLYVCWAFNVTAMSYIFSGVLTGDNSTAMQLANAKWIDFFGTASIIYMGSSELFKRLINVKKEADQFIKDANEKTVS